MPSKKLEEVVDKMNIEFDVTLECNFSFIYIKRYSNSWWYIRNNNLVHKGKRCQVKN